ncbi:hypothetical protein P152DRAFT_222206 [Eremomyces bilateralis CBS 781.70]|uniref:Zn(2)-C6 fungal-type domain-containing protein n=1 Tax=Eremomyces bilateralis CBS 781.70 TaxID=1392243 RepID=A0A6G1FRM8_9PEZI|nr:uncharacterized protein P152DRAFT_222206 [Eremomyces bilateralis CBS 781.70]KAF1808433.1 hypothetical protein P152DRAFT_222206 [Eremomyces bilateralis CBS 781.70]
MAGHYPYPHGAPSYHMNSGRPVYQQESFIPGLQPYPTVSSRHRSYVEFEDGARGLYAPQNSGRSRRRVGAGGEHVKHRRTRSGCFTCRHRRVKCDEIHPVCDRCRKGNRECKWPEASSSSKFRRGSRSKVSSEKESGSSGEDAEHEEVDVEGLPTIKDEDDGAEESSRTLADSGDVWALPEILRDGSNTPSLTHDKSPTPSTEGSTMASSKSPLKRASLSSSSISLSERWTQLPEDMQFFLDYHQKNINFNHYAFLFDATFLKTKYLEIALHHPPLMNAVAGFAAYHHTVSEGEGRVEDFLCYYNRSVTLLRQSLEQSTRHSNATLLTILQLASTEEFLGDWVNLMGHQRAAFEIITELYTPETIMQTDTLRVIITWYIRFDLFAGLLSGNGSCLNTEWFDAYYNYYLQQMRDHPGDLKCLFEERFAFQKLLGAHMAIAFARKKNGTISDKEFDRITDDLNEKINNWDANLDPFLTDKTKMINDFSGAPPRDPSEIFDPYEPGYLHSGEFFPINFLRISMWSVQLVFARHIAEIHQKPLPPGIHQIALDTCKMFLAMQRCPQSPPGTVLGIQASFAVAVVVIQREPYVSWILRKMAEVEAMGYSYPVMLRFQLTESLGIDVRHWWLPNNEGFPPIMQAVRQFVTERTATPRSPAAEDLHSLKGIFKSLSLHEDGQHSTGGAEPKIAGNSTLYGESQHFAHDYGSQYSR